MYKMMPKVHILRGKVLFRRIIIIGTKQGTNFRVIRVMCSGRVDPEHLLKAFSLGADGILVAGCHPADCHYIGGNYRTRRRIPLLKIMISQFGLEPSRLQLEWISASEGEK